MEPLVVYRIERYLDYLNFERGLSPNTLQAYRRDLSRFVDFALRRGRDTPDTVKPDDVRAYVLYLSERGLASASVRRAQSALRTYFSFLIEERLLEEDPTEGLRSPKVGRTLPTVLASHEIEVLLEAPSEDSPGYWRDRAILEVLYATGIRVSELIGLRIADLDLEAGILHRPVEPIHVLTELERLPVERPRRLRDRCPENDTRVVDGQHGFRVGYEFPFEIGDGCRHA